MWPAVGWLHFLSPLQPDFCSFALCVHSAGIRQPWDGSVCQRSRTQALWGFLHFGVWLSPSCGQWANIWHLCPPNSWHLGLECVCLLFYISNLWVLLSGGEDWVLPFPSMCAWVRAHTHHTHTHMRTHTHIYPSPTPLTPGPPTGWRTDSEDMNLSCVCTFSQRAVGFFNLHLVETALNFTANSSLML